MATWRTRTIDQMRKRGRAFVALAVAGLYAPVEGYNPEFVRAYAEDQVRRLCELNGWRCRWSQRRQG